MVRVGTSRRSQRRGFEELSVIHMIVHERYRPAEFINDIGLLKLEKNVKQGIKSTRQAFSYLIIYFELIQRLTLLFTNFIVGRINIANTICLPLHSLGETWDNKAVSVAGWGYTKLLEEGEWHPSPKVQVGDGMYCSYSSDHQMFKAFVLRTIDIR